MPMYPNTIIGPLGVNRVLLLKVKGVVLGLSGQFYERDKSGSK